MNEVTYTTKAARAVRILGEASCGKTEALLDAIAGLLDSGVSAQDIAVACASPNAAVEFERRLRARIGAEAACPRVRTARAWALDVLRAPEAITFTGREPRVLSQFEVSFLMEDMKTSGLRPRRLKEMLKFFYRTWTELGDLEEGWLLAGEEANVHGLLKECLGMTRGMLEPEIANLAVRFLADDATDAAPFALPHVFVDDYTQLSGASQVLMGMLATESLTVAGSPHEATEVFESYPFEAGLARFAEDNPACKTIELTLSHQAPEVRAVVNPLLVEDAGEEEAPLVTTADEAPAGNVRFIEFERPEDEFAGVSALVKNAIEGGLAPEDVLVIAPNRTWARQVARRLHADGMAVQALTANQPLGGDVRDRERSGAAFLFTALRLVADPNDAVAWRSWCGFGDYLTHSNSFVKLRAIMAEQDLSLPEALAYAEGLTTIGSDLAKLLAPYEFGRELIDALNETKGAALIDGLAERIEATDVEKAAVIALCAPAEDDDAATLVARAEQAMLAPVFQPGAVRVGTPEFACGMTPRLLAFCGFVNGFIPCRAYFDGAEMPLDKQERERARLVRQLYATVSKAQERLVCTHFAKTDLETAEMMKIKIKRIRLEKGVRTVLTEESIFGAVMRGE